MQESQLLTLVQLAQTGDREAFGALVNEFESLVFAVAYRRLRHQAEAAEVTQEVFLRALRKLDQLREPEKFVGWLKRIAVRMSINRAVRRPQETSTAPEGLSLFSIDCDQPITGVLEREAAQQLHSGIKRLRRQDRETLVAFYFEGQSLKEMSDRFESPIGTIKRRLHTARNRLREQLDDLQPA